MNLPVLQSRHARLDRADLDSMGFLKLVGSICSSGQAELPAALRPVLSKSCRNWEASFDSLHQISRMLCLLAH